ncbi:MAG: toprim domain-containing protein [Candidatus Aenigmarchaeota archaeon]|nr:toprim domain-containing protein [Candidatus Aenigmarchaeota archaeon]
MNTQEIEEELLKLLKENKEKQVIVEGKRDKKVLCLLGFKRIITLKKGIYETTEELKKKEVLILTDYDPEGKKIAHELNRILQSLSYKVDRETRRKIGFMFTRLKIRKIEELRGVLNE